MAYFQALTAWQCWQMLQNRSCRLLDVREPDEFASGHLPGALNIPLHTLTRRAPALLPSLTRPLLVYCGTGARSLPAVQVLSVMGYRQLYHLDGGLAHWPYGTVRDVL